MENGTSSICSRPCCGYGKNEHGELAIHEKQVEVVQPVYDLYFGDASVLGIVREPENQHIPSPSGKPAWPKRSIEQMLANEKHCGHVLVVKTYSTHSRN